MLNSNDRVIKHKLSLLNLGEVLGNKDGNETS